MKTPMFPLSNWSPNSIETFDLEDSEDVLGVARQLIDGHHPGVLTTVDEQGRPHSRWMATLAFNEFPNLHTITAPQSGKVRQIAFNPHVNWMFSNQDLSFIVNLAGNAEIISDTAVIKRVWKSIEDKSHAYFLHNFTERPGFAVIRTTVTEIICSIPPSNLIWSLDMSSFPKVTKTTKAMPQSWRAS